MPSVAHTSSQSILSGRSIDSVRPLKVICIGAGVSGILTAIRLPEKVKKLDLVIYDKNEELGGTWFENKYPGCACDILAHCYQLSFESNPAGTSFYARAPEILQYWKSVAEKYGVKKYLRLAHKALEARWDDNTAKWTVKLQDIQPGEIFDDSADALMLGIGVLNEWKWPEIPGLHAFQGTLLHSAVWEDNFQHNDKKVAVIGAGSSGIQIVPQLQPDVERLDHYVRGKTWVATTIAANEVKKRNDTGSNFDFTKDEIRAWQEDPALYLVYRKKLETELQSDHVITLRGTEAQKKAREVLTELMKKRLARKPHVTEHLLPDFPPFCKRLTPGPGYLEALTKDNVNVIATPIHRVTPIGVLTADSVHREVDAIVCATGFDTSWQNRFPIYGISGVKLGGKWKSRTDTYLSVTTHDFPNMFMSLGPNSGLGSGNLLIVLEKVAEYTAQVLEKMQTENILTIQPSARAAANFTDFCDAYFAGTVFSEECSSWYKTGGKNGRVSALWPGSSLHAVKALERPRWEDFQYTYVDGNEFGWIGDCWSQLDRLDGVDRAYYLNTQQMIHHPLEKGQEITGANGKPARSFL